MESLLLGSPAGQLACFTVEGMIRANVRMAHHGLCHPPSVVFHAYRRWGSIQGTPPSVMAGGGEHWPDGWLSQQAPLAQRRGNAPATVRALKATPSGSVANSAGHHALSNTAPLALFGTVLTDVRGTAIELAAVTHGHPAAQKAAADGVELLIRAMQTSSLRELNLEDPAEGDDNPGTARGSLTNAVASARQHPEPAQFLDALARASHLGGRGASTFAGALLGACHGVAALPQEWIGRLELGIIGNTLARDAIREIDEGPSGSEYAPNADRWWWHRYPGW